MFTYAAILTVSPKINLKKKTQPLPLGKDKLAKFVANIYMQFY